MTTVYKGYNSISKIKKILNLERPTSILLIRGNRSYETCVAKDNLESQLSDYNVTFLSGFKLYITPEDIKKTIDIIKEKKIDFIIAVGGGTVMDIGKAAAILYSEQGPFEGYITGEKKPKGESIKKLLIPTTAGSGAEVTPRSTIYINKLKCSLSHPSMSPDYIILAPELTYNMSLRVTAQTGCDALASAIEGFWSAKATEETKEYSRKAIPLIMNNLSQAVNNPTPKSRKAMLMGSYLAGKSILSANTTAAHALSYPLTVYHNIPHGHAAMLSLPHFFPLNEQVTGENIQEGLDLEYVKKTFNELLLMLGVKNGIEARDKLLSIMDGIHLEKRLSDFGVKKEDIDNIIKFGSSPTRLKNNPRKITEKDLKKLLGGIL